MNALDLGLVAGGGALFLGADTLAVGRPDAARVLKLAGASLAVLGAWRLVSKVRAADGLIAGAAALVVAPDETKVGKTVMLPAPPLELPPIEDREPSKVPATAPSTGVAAGAKVYDVTAELVSPVAGGSVKRKLFTTLFPITVELANWTNKPRRVHVALRLTLARLGSTDELAHDLGQHDVGPLGVARFKAEVASGNYHTGLFELGSANVAAALFVDGRQVQSTSFFLA